MENADNFNRSSLPIRVLFLCIDSNGQNVWVDFPRSDVDTVQFAFAVRRPTIPVEINGRPCVVDLLRMIAMDLYSRLECSVAWMDDTGRWFYPRFAINGDGSGPRRGGARHGFRPRNGDRGTEGGGSSTVPTILDFDTEPPAASESSDEDV